MKTGTKSILFGVHQFIWHPTTVLLAWHKLYGRPNWKEFVCIIIHDWGYWSCRKMDDQEGELHPLWAAYWVEKWFGQKYYNLCLYHSRHLAKRLKHEPSKLCWADKFSIIYDPWWFYIPRAWLSGEIQEYRKNAAKLGHVFIESSHRSWLKWVKEIMKRVAEKRNGDAAPYNMQGGI